MKELKTKSTPFTKSFNNNDLSFTDNLVYATLHTFRDNETGKCNPTMQQMADISGLSKFAVNESINNLANKGYITISQRKLLDKETGKAIKTNNYYYMPNIKGFNMIPIDFINSKEYSPKLKGFAITFRGLFFNDTLICKYTNKEICEKLNIDNRTLKKYLKEMENNNMMVIDKNLYQLNNDIIDWRITKLEKEVETIKENKADKKEVDKLQSELESCKNEIKELKAILFKSMKNQKQSKDYNNYCDVYI